MKRRSFITAAIAAPAVLSFSPLRAQTRQKITYAYLLDPAYETVVWAIRNGKVKSDLIDVEATGLLIPQLIQATSAKQYDAIMTAVIGLPAGLARGLQLRILSAALENSPAGEGGGVWVKKGSPLKTGADLKGKTLGSYGLRSTGYMFVRQAIAKEYGLNMALDGGDVRQVEIQAPNLPAALAAGQVDAAALIHSQAWRAQQTGDFVDIVQSGKILDKLYGPLVSAINVSYPEKLEAKPAAFEEFNRMLKASVQYALANRKEVFGAVAKQANIDPAYFEWWFSKASTVPAIFGAQQANAVKTAWQIAKDLGMIKSAPDVASVTWNKALKS